MNHLLAGAALPFILAVLVYLARGGRASPALLAITPATMALCGLWALIPDIPRLLGLHTLYLQLAQDPRINLFFWHYRLDQTEADSSWYAALLFLMAAGLILAALRELKRQEAS